MNEEKCVCCADTIPEGRQVCPNCHTKEPKIEKLKPCPFCKEIWLFVSDGDYYSGYESFGYRLNCRCGFAWKAITWKNAEKEAIEAWNKRAKTK